MSNSRIQSNKLKAFLIDYIKVSDNQEKDLLWNSLTTPFIEEIDSDNLNFLVTFLYRKKVSDSHFKIYIDCQAIGLPFTPKTQLNAVPDTDLFYLTIKLPSTLRTTYTFLKLDDKNRISETTDEPPTYPLPQFTGEYKKIIDMILKTHKEEKFEIDVRNPKKISYHDYDDPKICFFKESILELPDAPTQPDYFYDINLIKSERDKLTKENRFSEHKLSFVNTSLKDLPQYKDNKENKDEPPKATRAYWVYLPPHFNHKKAYPLFFFLDGSDYLNRIHKRVELEMEIFCDAKTCIDTGTDTKEYANFLLAMTCTQSNNLVFNNLTGSTLKRRFIAMKQKNRNSKFLIAVFNLILFIISSATIAMASGITESSSGFKITSKIVIDGKLVSSPIIIAKANQKALIVLTDTNDAGAQGLRLELVAKNAAMFGSNNAISINYDFQYINGKEKLHAKPQVVVVPNQESKIHISSGPKHFYEIIVLAERVIS